MVVNLASASQPFSCLIKLFKLADSPRGTTAVRKGAASPLPIARFFVSTSSLFLLRIWLAFLLLSSLLMSWLRRFVATLTCTRPKFCFSIRHNIIKAILNTYYNMFFLPLLVLSISLLLRCLPVLCDLFCCLSKPARCEVCS